MFDSLGTACVAATSLAFLTASVGKALRPTEFLKTLDVAATGLPEGARRLLVATLPFLEFALAVALWPDATRRGAAIGCAGLLVLFGTVAYWTEHRGQSVGCNCFGVGTAKLGAPTIARNVVLFAPVLVIAVSGNRVDVSNVGGWVPVAITTIGIAGVVLLAEIIVGVWREASTIREASTLIGGSA